MSVVICYKMGVFYYGYANFRNHISLNLYKIKKPPKSYDLGGFAIY